MTLVPLTMAYPHLDYFHEQLSGLQRQKEVLPYRDSDVRKDFYAFMIATLDTFYKSLTVFGVCELMAKGQVQFVNSSDNEAFYPHLSRLLEIYTEPIALRNYRNKTYRTLVIDSWSLYESALNAICHHALDRKKQLERIHQRTAKKKFVMREGHISYLSIRQKYELLYEMAQHSHPDTDFGADKAFLEFFGTLRNCMHNNFIYYGKSYRYTFEGCVFLFEHGRPLQHESAVPVSSQHFFNLALKLVRVYSRLNEHIPYPQFIPYPEGSR